MFVSWVGFDVRERKEASERDEKKICEVDWVCVMQFLGK